MIDSKELYFIPIICRKGINGESELEGTQKYVEEALKVLNIKMSQFFKNSQKLNSYYLTDEERKAVLKLEEIREKELIGYYKALKTIKKAPEKKFSFKHALNIYEEAQRNFKEFLKQLESFIIMNLVSKNRVAIAL